MPDGRPIGIFDSGVGGLTVARAIIDLLPHESLLYVGDTANSPYGPKSQDEIRALATDIARNLVAQDVKMLVVACNSVEVSAIEDVVRTAQVPVVGVVEPGVRAAARATRSGVVGMIGTEATVASGQYTRAVEAAGAGLTLVSQACPAFVEHVERGDTSSEALRELARGYLAPLRAADVDTLILGCTHYPLLSGLLSYVMGSDVVLVSSAEETAKDVYAALLDLGLAAPDGSVPTYAFRSTGDPAQFRTLAERFLGPEVAALRTVEAAWN